ncbi:MAG: hypothetical protein ACXVB4_17165 [Pseudobdellovibrionaceae bacterium]
MQKKNSPKSTEKDQATIPEELYSPTGTINVSHNAHNIRGQSAAISLSRGGGISGRSSETGINRQADEIARKQEMIKQHRKKKTQ